MPRVEAVVGYHLVQEGAAVYGQPFEAHGNLSAPGVSGSAMDTPVIRGSAIKGRLRATACRLTAALGLPACTDPATCALGERCSVCTIFGNRQIASPFVYTDAAPPPDVARLMNPVTGWRTFREQRVRVAVERTTGTALARTRAGTEAVPEGMVYLASIRGWIPAPSQPDVLPLSLLLLIAALRATNTIGGMRSTGLGMCTISIDSVQLGERTQPGDEALDQLARLGHGTEA